MNDVYVSDEINELCRNIDLVKYVSSEYGLDIKRRGNKLFAHCPLHIDNTASLCFYENDNTFYCYSCKKYGNLLTWLIEYENYSYGLAVDKILNISGKKKEDVLLTCSSVKEFKKFDKKHNNKNLEKRKIYDMSYYTKYKKEYPQEWIEEGIPKEAMDKYDIRIDYTSNRIVYPLYDNEFNLVGIKGRTRWKDWKSIGISSKYMAYNAFGKTDFFVGMKENVDNIKNKDEAIIVEGIKSVMKLDSYGFHNGLASETSTINDEQIKVLLKLRIKNVVFAFDKGVNTRNISKPLNILKRFMNVYIIEDRGHLLENKDAPVDKGREVWEKLYAQKRRW